MLPNPLIAFDIETIPDPDVGRRILGFEGDDFSVVRQMFKQRLEEMDGRTGYPQQPHHRVVTIGVARLDPEDGSFSVDVVGGDAMDERSHLGRVLQGAVAGGTVTGNRPPEQPIQSPSGQQSPGSAPRLISWNGNGFDLPIIRYRAMLNGIAMPELYRTRMADPEVPTDYQYRYPGHGTSI